MNILVAEDESAIREVEVAYLKKTGFNVFEAENGREAINIFEAQEVDLMVLDIHMPLVNGIEVCRTVRQTSTVPIIVVTAMESDQDELKGFQAGADDYIKKPFNPNVFVARVQNLLQRHSHARITHDDLIIDPTTMSVTEQGRPIVLTTTQFNILFVLASQPDRVFTRAQLIDEVYDDPAGHDIYDRTIDAHIKSIRKAIHDDPAHPQYIQTVIGRGYRLGKQRS